MSDRPPATLNPAQLEVLELLRIPDDDRPRFDADLRHRLRAHLEAALAPVAATLPTERTLWISKYNLAQVHGCEASHLADEAADFHWTVQLARGTVVHKAVELSVHWKGDLVPLVLVDEAMARLEHDDQAVTDFLRRCTEGDVAELRAQAGEATTKFLECFPPLARSWRPVTESKVRIDLCNQAITLQGRVDLSLGQPQGTTAGKVLIDLKTGSFAPNHRDDLRFYALLETVRLGTPPMLLASYYLDSGRLHPEHVTEDLLESAAERVIGGAERMARLQLAPEEAVKRTGPACRWCRLRESCDEGLAHLEGGGGTDGWDG